MVQENEIEVLSEKEVKMVWIVTYWDFDQEPVVTPLTTAKMLRNVGLILKEFMMAAV